MKAILKVLALDFVRVIVDKCHIEFEDIVAKIVNINGSASLVFAFRHRLTNEGTIAPIDQFLTQQSVVL